MSGKKKTPEAVQAEQAQAVEQDAKATQKLQAADPAPAAKPETKAEEKPASAAKQEPKAEEKPASKKKAGLNLS
ncbi:MAG: hypothetical protein K2L51_01600, partial [Clostridiales bacterium]|nr:hypothetical protein [Clostridiales bacterium]